MICNIENRYHNSSFNEALSKLKISNSNNSYCTVKITIWCVDDCSFNSGIEIVKYAYDYKYFSERNKVELNQVHL